MKCCAFCGPKAEVGGCSTLRDFAAWAAALADLVLPDGPLRKGFRSSTLQARWVLGGVAADEWPHLALLAVENGFDGTAVRQLLGLIRPTTRDLGHLPERAFAEMGLGKCDAEQAVSVLLQRVKTLASPTILEIVDSFPEFLPLWRKHLAEWRGKTAGAYIDMAEFVHFVVEDLYEKGKVDETKRAFASLETKFAVGDQEVRDLIGLGFIRAERNRTGD